MKYAYEVLPQNIGLFRLEGNLIGESDGMELTHLLAEELEGGVHNFIIDLSSLQHINSSGLGVFITLLTKARKKDGELLLVRPSSYIYNLLAITKLNNIFTICDSVELAVEKLEAN